MGLAMIIKFDHARKVLSDNSEVFDVMVHVDEEMRVTVWNAPSETTADACAFALNSVLNEFQNCGSNFEALALMERVRKVL